MKCALTMRLATESQGTIDSANGSNALRSAASFAETPLPPPQLALRQLLSGGCVYELQERLTELR